MTAGAPDGSLVTDEQQQGRAATAVKALHDELVRRYSTIAGAEDKLSAVLLEAHATTSDGRAKLQEIQSKIIEAVRNPAMDISSAAGERAYLRFLRGQVGQVRDLLTSSGLSDEDQAAAARALGALYSGDGDGTVDTRAVGVPDDPASQPHAGPSPEPAALDDLASEPAALDPRAVGVGPLPCTPRPTVSVLGSPLGPLGADPMTPALGAMLPGALGGVGGLGGLGPSPLAALAGAINPLAGLSSGLGGPAVPLADRPERAEATPAGNRPTTQEKVQPPADDHGPPLLAAERPPAPVAAPSAASTTVQLPDGSEAQARTSAAAQAVRDWLKGGPVEASYRDNGLTLPPVGTPVINPVPPNAVSCGDIAVFSDHVVPVLSAVKAIVDGNVVPLSQVTSGPNFLGFIDPTAVATGGTAAAPPAPAVASPAAPAPAGVAASAG